MIEMACCDKSKDFKSKDFKFCPECGKKFSEDSSEVKICRDILNRIFLKDYGLESRAIIINKRDLNKTCVLNKKYEMYTERTSIDNIFVEICSPYYPYCEFYYAGTGGSCGLRHGSMLNAIKDKCYVIKNDMIHHLSFNSILEDMQIQYFYPHVGITIEDAIVGFTNTGINDPTYLFEVVCDKKHNKYTTTLKGFCDYISNSVSWYNDKVNETISCYKDAISNLLSIKANFYMLDNKVYMLDELNNKYCTDLIIDWDKCVIRIHHIKDITVNVLYDETVTLLKRIEENAKIRKIISAVKMKNNEKNITVESML